MITKNCLQCGEEFESYPSKNRKYCTRECGYKSCSKTICSNNCLYCEKKFKFLKGQNRKFCDKNCSDKFPRKREINKIIKNCSYCKKEFESYPSENRKYCTRECLDLSKMTKVLIDCDYCGKEKLIFKSNVLNNNFCDQSCNKKFLTRLNSVYDWSLDTLKEDFNAVLNRQCQK